MSSQPAVEASAVDKPARATKPVARKRTAAATKPTPVELGQVSPDPGPVVAVKQKRHTLRAMAGFGFVLAAAVATLLFVGQDDPPAQDSSAPVTVSAAELASFAGSVGSPVYWGGELPSRTIELTTTATGTFVRYLPAGTTVGGSSRALTIATYPLQDAYGTAARRAKAAGMTSRQTRNGGLAVWSKAQPTSVYVAFRGAPSLIEVYAPQAKEARTLALSGRIRAVR
jgi:hypothetical protein